MDVFGIPVSLTHKGDTAYSTNIGSTFSIVAFILVLYFFITKFAGFITQSAEVDFRAYPLNRDLYDPD